MTKLNETKQIERFESDQTAIQRERMIKRLEAYQKKLAEIQNR